MAVGKRLRFEVFKRDGFRCFYCGASPLANTLTVKLHADHVEPKSKGGEDDAANLVTACVDCNLGKSDIRLDEKRLRSGFASDEEREHAEQIREFLAVQREIAAAKRDAEAIVLEHWEDRIGEFHWQLPRFIPGSIRDFGVEGALQAIDIVAQRGISSPTDQLKYFCGVLRNWREKVNDKKRSAEAIAAEWKGAIDVFTAYCSYRWYEQPTDLSGLVKQALSGKLSIADLYRAADMAAWVDTTPVQDAAEYDEHVCEKRFREYVTAGIAAGARSIPWQHIQHLTQKRIDKRIKEQLQEDIARQWWDFSDGEAASEETHDVVSQAIADIGAPYLAILMERFLNEREDLPRELEAAFFRRAIIWHTNPAWMRQLPGESPIRKWPEFSELVGVEA